MLGCPKKLVDSESILTQLRTEVYNVTNSYDDDEHDVWGVRVED